MRIVALSFFIPIFAVAAFAQDKSGPTSPEASTRKALLQEMVNQDRGDITVMEASSKEDGSVILGYSSGAVSICSENRPCTEFAGTPNVPVQRIAASRNGASEIIWVSYRQGAIYRCVNSQCSKSGRLETHE